MGRFMGTKLRGDSERNSKADRPQSKRTGTVGDGSRIKTTRGGSNSQPITDLNYKEKLEKAIESNNDTDIEPDFYILRLKQSWIRFSLTEDDISNTMKLVPSLDFATKIPTLDQAIDIAGHPIVRHLAIEIWASFPEKGKRRYKFYRHSSLEGARKNIMENY